MMNESCDDINIDAGGVAGDIGGRATAVHTGSIAAELDIPIFTLCAHARLNVRGITRCTVTF